MPVNASCSHIDTNQLICTESQLTGFYMSATLAYLMVKLKALVHGNMEP